ncbi:MAG: hypothetical protein WBN22_14050 [Verrucomicrobiia bacterium]
MLKKAVKYISVPPSGSRRNPQILSKNNAGNDRIKAIIEKTSVILGCPIAYPQSSTTARTSTVSTIAAITPPQIAAFNTALSLFCFLDFPSATISNLRFISA